jgi:tRNA(fMet)-specific endonuclease VapC
MSQIVVDTDVASYIFNWHSSAQRYVDALRGSQLILSFMSIAEMRMGAIAAGWGVRRRTLLEQFISDFGAVYADDALCTSWSALRAGARAAGRSLSPQDAWIAATRWRSMPRSPQTIGATLSMSTSFGCSPDERVIDAHAREAGLTRVRVLRRAPRMRCLRRSKPERRA